MEEASDVRPLRSSSGSAWHSPAPIAPDRYHTDVHRGSNDLRTDWVGSGAARQREGRSRAISGNGPVTFATPIAGGAAYRVTVFTQPSSPAQGCVVTGGSGTVSRANVTTVGIACATHTPTPSGAPSLVSSGRAWCSATTAATISRSPLMDRSPSRLPSLPALDYNVTVLSQPTNPAQTCIVTSGSGTVTDADVTTVAVACYLSGSASPLLVSSPMPDPSPSAVVYVSLPPGANPERRQRDHPESPHRQQCHLPRW